MLQAKGFDTYTDTSASPLSTPEVHRFPYGWRYVKKKLSTGTVVYDQIPLTIDDLLNPQEGDQVPQSNEHFQAIVDLVSTLKTHYDTDPTMAVFGDLIMDWGIPGLSNPAPDMAIVPNVQRKQIRRGTFKVVKEGTRPGFVLEVMSPGSPIDLKTKMRIYQTAGIPEYFLIKPVVSEPEEICYELSGYRLEKGLYHRIHPDEQGRLLSQTLQFWFSVINEGRQVRVTDVRTGQPLLTQIETEQARLAAEARADAEATRADAEAKIRVELETRLRELENLLNSTRR
jgi:Uma2 family endonuclease